MAFYKDEKIALFIDGASLYAVARVLNIEIDFRKLLEEFRKRGRLVRANYYTTLIEGEEYSPIKPLVDWLSYNGFNTVVKQAREWVDRDGRRRMRGTMDVELAVDMLELAGFVDHVVLFSGNGDFRRAVEAVKARGVRVTIISTLQGQPAIIGDDLRRVADVFVDLSDMADLIGRPRREHDERSPTGSEGYVA